ncbi:MAG TPA: hypothetical protein VMI11_04900 [Actinomycetes bacterium]|nr:hypothetical protein [Actinomycetes bacterium]
MADELQTLDVVEAPHGRPPRRRERVLAGALVVVGLLGLAVPVVNAHLERQEYASLVACVRQGQAAVSDAETRLSAIRDYVAPALFSVNSDRVRQGMLDLVSSSARSVRPAVSEALASCRAVPARRWHHGIASARATYISYLAAHDAFYAVAENDGSAAFGRVVAPSPGLVRQRVLAAAPTTGARAAARAALDAQ